MVNDDDFGGFVVSNNVLDGRLAGFVFREVSSIEVLNGWNVYSVDDDQDYISDPKNFTIVSATTISNILPVLLEIFDAPYGTDLAFMYEQDVHIGFWDLNKDKEITIKEILGE